MMNEKRSSPRAETQENNEFIELKFLIEQHFKEVAHFWTRTNVFLVTNVAAFGVESVDPIVIKNNNLKATKHDVLDAIRIINEIGSKKGKNGMPELLPGLNFVFGLAGETKKTLHSRNGNIVHLSISHEKISAIAFVTIE